ncbi:MAG: hypothetical protein ACT6FF_10450, partial [Methanosarcinaceae archaeon]
LHKLGHSGSLWDMLLPKDEKHKKSNRLGKGQRHRGTEAQRDKGTKGQRDKGTKGQRDKGTKGLRH